MVLARISVSHQLGTLSTVVGFFVRNDAQVPALVHLLLRGPSDFRRNGHVKPGLAFDRQRAAT